MSNSIKPQKRAEILIEVLPYVRKYKNKIIVLKIGGNVISDDKQLEGFAHDIVFLKMLELHPIIVHGGGPQIGEYLKKLNIQNEFVRGIRKTDKKTMEIVEMVLAGSINKNITAKIQSLGGKAIGISGRDAMLIQAKQTQENNVGLVGYPQKINTEILKTTINQGFIPVIAPIGADSKMQPLNINADIAAGAIAAAINAKRLIIITNVQGVKDAEGNIISEINLMHAKKILDQEIVKQGMIPKLQTCIKAIEDGVEAAVIIDGRKKHATLLELFTKEGGGTKITLNDYDKNT